MKERMHFVRMIVLCLMTAFLAVAVLTLGASEQAQAGTSEPEPLGDPGSGWIFDELVGFLPNEDNSPALATGPNGTLHAAWQHDTGGPFKICYAFSLDGGVTWSTCNMLPSATGDQDPDIVVSPLDGRIYIAYAGFQIPGNRDIFVGFSDTGQSWNLVAVSFAADDEYRPSIVLEHDMDPYLVHVAFESNQLPDGYDLHVYVSPDRGLMWIEQFRHGVADPTIYSNPELAYQRCTDGFQRLYMLHFSDSINAWIRWSEDNGNTWPGFGMIWSSPEPKTGMTVAASRDGDTIVVAWEEQIPGDYGLRYAYDDDPTTPGAGWISSDINTVNLNDRAPQLSADGEGTMSTAIGGKFHLVWTTATVRIDYTSVNTDMSGGWAPFDTPADSVAIHAQGEAKGLTTQNRGGTWYPAISWMDGRLVDWDIYYTTPGSRVTVDANITGLYMFVDGQNVTLPEPYNWPAGLNHSFDMPSPQYINATARAVWLDWSDTGAQNHSVQATTFDTIYTAGFMFQYRVSFVAAPAVGGLEARIDGMFESLPKSYWWFIGSDHEIFAPSPQLQTPTSRYAFDYWSDFGPQLHDITVLGDRTYTCFFIREYYVTIDTNPTGLNVEIDAPTYVAPQSFWWEEGSMHNLNAPSPQSGPIGTQYVFSSWSDSLPQSHTIIVNGPGTFTANFGTQYQIDFGTNPAGLDVVIDTVTYMTPWSFWWDDGSSHFIDVTSPQAGGPGEQFVFSQWSDFGPQGHIIVTSGPDALTATFTRQYYLTVTSPYGVTSGEGWYDEMTDAYAGLNTDVYVVVPAAERYVFVSWSGDASGGDYLQSNPMLMDAPKTATTSWQLQWYLTVSSPYGVVTGDGWYDDGSQAFAGLDTDVYVVTPNAERFVFTNWGGDASGANYAQSDAILMDSPKTASALWTQQYYLLVDSAYAMTSGEGWYDQMAPAYAGLDTDIWVTIPNQERFVFLQWSGDATGGDYLQSDPITMDGPKMAQAEWTHEVYLTVTSPYGTTSGEGWYETGTIAYAGLDIDTYVVAPSVERWLFASWGGDATGANYLQSDPIMMDQPMAADAIWQQQFYLTVTSPYGAPSGEGWFNAGATVYAGLDIDLVVIVPNEERYIFSNWAGDATGSDYLQSDQILMDSAKAADAIWRHEYSLSIQSTYGTPIGDGWFEEMNAVPAGLDIGIYVVTPSAERFVFLQWTGDASGVDYMASDPIAMNGPKTAIAQWTHEYYLTVDTSYGTPTGEGWYVEGTQAYAGLDTGTYVVIPNVERYIFEGWDDGATGIDYAVSDPILMNGPMTAYAAWLHQYWIIVRAESGGTPLLGITVSTDAGVVGTTPYSEWFNDGMTYNIGVEDPADVGGTDYEFLYWDYGPTDNPVSYTVAGSATIIAEYQEIVGPYFEVHISPVSRQIAAGEVTTYYVNVSSHNGYDGNVSLSLSGLTAPAQGTFNPEYVILIADSTEMSVLTISNTGSLTQTTHTLTATGNDGTMTDVEDASLIVSGIAATGSISGTVTDQDLTLLAGVVVDLMVDQTVLSTQTTGSGGEFNFTDLSAGAYTVRASLSGYADDNETVTLIAGGWETATLQLDEIRGSVSGVVRDVETSAIIDGATVEAYDLSGNLLGSDTSTPTGRFLIPDLPLGTFDLRAWADGYEMETVADLQATLLANEVDVGDVYLTPEAEPADAAGLADYWWVILIIAVVVVLLLVLVAKRRKPEEIEELDEEPAEAEEEAETLEEQGLDELLDDEWLKEIE